MTIHVTLLSPEHRDAFASFSREVWNADVDAPSWNGLPGDARNPYENIAPSRAAILLRGDRIVGHLTSTPAKLWCGERDSFIHWLSGFHVLPEVRGQGLAKLLVEELMKVHQLLSGVVVVEASRKSFLSCGWSFDWTIPEFAKLLRVRELASELSFDEVNAMPASLRRVGVRLGPSQVRAGAAIAAVGNAAYQRGLALTRATGVAEMIQPSEFGEEIDELWTRNRPRILCGQARESRYLNFMFPFRGGWRKIALKAGDRVLGYAVLAIRRLDNWKGFRKVTLATVIDCVWDFDRPEIARELLDAAETIARAEGAHALLASGTHPSFRSAAYRCGFLPIPGTVWYGYVNTGSPVTLPLSPSQWFANRGDADAAGSLGPSPD